MRKTVHIVGMFLFLVRMTSAGFAQGFQNPICKQTPSREGVPEKIIRLQERAEEDDAQAEYCLGMAYISRTEVACDYRQAIKWQRAAAAQGLPDAQFALAYLYEEGKGTRKDYREAAKFYRAAGEQGHL